MSVPKVITVSAVSGEFSPLISEFVESLKKFSIQAKKTEKKGWIQLVRNTAYHNPEDPNEPKVRVVPA
ncbi:MAG TPA: hypothetical protein PLI30_12185, partial [Petrimonas sp.]|nr:hypothetical protein [Petrimonas sp.]